MSLQNIFNRVADWNNNHLPRKYSRNLSSELLTEGSNRLNNAETPVEKVSALCEIVIVAYGSLWSLSVNNLILGRHDMVTLNIKNFNGNGLSSDDERLKLYSVINSSLLMLRSNFGLNENRVLKALSIVCDSDDTKMVTSSYQDKGLSYVKPEPRIKRLLKGDRLWMI